MEKDQLPAAGERAWAPSAPAGTREPSGRRGAGQRDGGGGGGGGAARAGAPRSPAVPGRSAPLDRPGAQRPSRPPPRQRPPPPAASPPPRPGTRPSPRPTARTPEAPARYLVRHGDGGFPGSPHRSGLRQAGAHSEVYKSVSSPQHNTASAGTSVQGLRSLAIFRCLLSRLGRREKPGSDLTLCQGGDRPEVTSAPSILREGDLHAGFSMRGGVGRFGGVV
ncbi:hypothetical protein LEMLEM_LOCUS16685 [Lemmus lemmus]